MQLATKNERVCALCFVSVFPLKYVLFNPSVSSPSDGDKKKKPIGRPEPTHGLPAKLATLKVSTQNV